MQSHVKRVIPDNLLWQLGLGIEDYMCRSLLIKLYRQICNNNRKGLSIGINGCPAGCV